MNIIFYEFKKAAKSKVIKRFFVILLIFNALLCCYMCDAESDKNDPAAYIGRIEKLISQTERKLALLSEDDLGGFTEHYFSSLTDKYGVVLDTVTDGEEISGWGQYFEYDTSYLLALFCCSLYAIYSFRSEKQSGMFSVVYAAKKGRSHYVISKTVSLLAVTFITVILFCLSSAVGIILKNGTAVFSGGGSYLQMLSEYVFCPFAWRTWQVGVAALIYCTLIVYSIALPVGVISYMFDDNMIPFFSFSLMTAGMYYLSSKKYMSYNSFGQHCNWISALRVSDILKEYRCVKAGDLAIPVYSANLYIAALNIAVMLLCFALLHSCKITVPINKLFKSILPSFIKGKRKPDEKEYKQKGGDGIAYFELKKIQSSKYVTACLFILLVIKIIMSVYPLMIERSYKDRIYQEYCEAWEGLPDGDKQSEIEAEKQFLSDSLSEYIIYRQAMSKQGEYDDGSIETVENNYRYTMLHEEPFNTFENKYRHVTRMHQEVNTEARVFYDTGYIALWENGDDLLLLISVICLCTFIFSGDSCSFELQRATPYGRARTFRVKMIIAVLSSAVIYVAFTLIADIPLLIKYDLADSTYLICGIEGYEKIFEHSGSISVGAYTVFIRAIGFVSYLSVAVTTCCITAMVRAQLPVLAAIGTVAFLPRLLGAVSDNMGYTAFDICAPLNGNAFVENCVEYGTGYCFGIFAVIVILPLFLFLLSRHRYNRCLYKKPKEA